MAKTNKSSIVYERDFCLYAFSVLTLVSTIIASKVTGDHEWVMLGFVTFMITSYIIILRSSGKMANLVSFTLFTIFLALVVYVGEIGPADANVDPSFLPK